MFRRFFNIRNRSVYRPLSRNRRVVLQVRNLDDKCLPSGGLAPVLELEPNDTMDVAQLMTLPTTNDTIRVVGNIGNGITAASDVDWYKFHIDTASSVQLTISSSDGQSHPVLGIYETRLLVQNTGTEAIGRINRNLAPGDYCVAVSGVGNSEFNPYLPSSGYPGQTGDYVLSLRTDPIILPAGSGPIVINLDSKIAGGNNSAPPALKLQTNAPLDPASLSIGTNIFLTYNPTGNFGGVNDANVPLATVSYDATRFEMRITPERPLRGGYYSLTILGDNTKTSTPVTGVDQLALGFDRAHPNGQNDVRTFRIIGTEAETGNDTAATSIDLGRLHDGSFVRKLGFIGDDPLAFNSLIGTQSTANPAAGVDMYHFQIMGAGHFAFTAEAFSGRIGSSFDSGLSLYRKDPQTGLLVLVNSNRDSLNPAKSTVGTLPLSADPLLHSGLQAGDYYIAVASNTNTPGFAVDSRSGENGIFDPNITHSGMNGSFVGRYSLNVYVERDDVAPQVLATNPTPGQILGTTPETITVRFNEEMNFQEYFDKRLSGIYIQSADGSRSVPRLLSYDPTTFEATFLMLDGLRNGNYELRLCGTGGLTDLAGNPIQGNSPEGDLITSFSVVDPVRGFVSNPQDRLAVASEAGNPQNLGTLFPNELQKIVVLSKTASSGVSGDIYQFRILQTQLYCFDLQGQNLPDDARIIMTDLKGNPTNLISPSNLTLFGQLAQGDYLIRVEGLVGSGSSDYQLAFKLVGDPGNPQVPTQGTAPSIRFRLAGDTTDPVIVSKASIPSRSGTTMALLSAGPIGGLNTGVAGSSDDRLAAKPAATPSQALTLGTILTTTLLESPRVITGDEMPTVVNASIADLSAVIRVGSKLVDSARRVGSQLIQMTRHLAEMLTPFPAALNSPRPAVEKTPEETAAHLVETDEEEIVQEIPVATRTSVESNVSVNTAAPGTRMIGNETESNQKVPVFMKIVGLVSLSGIWLWNSYLNSKPRERRQFSSLEKSPKGVTL